MRSVKIPFEVSSFSTESRTVQNFLYKKKANISILLKKIINLYFLKKALSYSDC